jgi:hypothetical protein
MCNGKVSLSSHFNFQNDSQQTGMYMLKMAAQIAPYHPIIMATLKEILIKLKKLLKNEVSYKKISNMTQKSTNFIRNTFYTAYLSKYNL